ncbi:MAG TPA: hypothetical protein VGL00_20625 [Terracidiphilus sp.]
MKRRMFLLVLSAMAMSSSLPAQTDGYEQWVGVWEGQLEGQPGVTVTLGRDGGDVQGTIVFNVVARGQGEQPHVIGHDAHVLTHVDLNGTTLAFHVVRLGDGRELHLEMRLGNDGKAVLECADCGGPSATELTPIH